MPSSQPRKAPPAPPGLTVEAFRRKWVATMSEAALQKQVIEGIRKLHGDKALIYHVHDSRSDDWASDSGFPDLVVVMPHRTWQESSGALRGRTLKRPRVIYIELKAERGKATPAQQAWHDALKAAGQEAHILRPSDFPKAWELLE